MNILQLLPFRSSVAVVIVLVDESDYVVIGIPAISSVITVVLHFDKHLIVNTSSK